MDWISLFRWIYKHSMTSKPKKIPKMSQEQEEWVEAAFKSFNREDIRKMIHILHDISPKIGNVEFEEEVLDKLSIMRELLDVPDAAASFCKSSGMLEIYDHALNPKLSNAIRTSCFSIISACAQNNTFVQKFFSRININQILLSAIDAEEKLKLRAITALSAILKGNNINNKRIFLAKDGLIDLLKMLRIKNPEQIDARLFNILQDILEHAIFLNLDISHIEFDTDPNKLKPKKEFSNFPDILKSQMKEIQLITAQHAHHAFKTLPDLKTQPYRLGVLHTLKSFDQICHQWKLEKDQKLWKDSKLTVLGMRKKIETQGRCEVLAIEDDLAAEILKLK